MPQELRESSPEGFLQFPGIKARYFDGRLSRLAAGSGTGCVGSERVLEATDATVYILMVAADDMIHSPVPEAVIIDSIDEVKTEKSNSVMLTLCCCEVNKE